LICLVQALPLEVCEQGATLLGWLFHRVLPLRRRVVQENLRHALPELSEAERDRLALAMWRHLFLVAAEVAHTSRCIHAANWKRKIEVHGAPQLVRHLLDDRPLVLVS